MTDERRDKPTPETDDLILAAVRQSQQVARVEASLARLRDELVQRTQELSAERGRLGAVIASMADGMLALDDARCVTLANQAAADILGCSLDELYAMPAERLPKALLDSREDASGARTARIQGRALRIARSHYRDAQGKPGVVLVLHDVTREAEIDRLKSELISIVSHELRAPLATIKSYADLLMDPEPRGEEGREAFIELVRAKALGMIRLVDDLLDLERIGGGTAGHEPVPVAYLMQAVYVALKPRAAEGEITLEQHPPATRLYVEGDLTQLERALLNLAENAVKYTPAGGRVTLWARAGENEITLGVDDTGPGIAQQHLPRLFERFYRVPHDGPRRPRGSGLGLAIVQAIAQAHHGRVEVESTPGQGSRFALVLPAAPPGGARTS